MRLLHVFLILLYFVTGIVIGSFAMQVRYEKASRCARTTADFSDSGINKCYEDRGLPGPV